MRMQKRQLGQNGPMVGAVALGTMNFCGTYGETTQDQALRCMAECLDLGVDHFDTSNVYGMGRAEDLLSRFLKHHRHRVVLASKCGITRNPDHPFDNSADHMRQALEDSLRRLGVERIDLYYLHRHEVARPIEEVMQVLLRFRDEGKIGAVGLSEVSPATLQRARAVGPVAAVQSEYSLWTRQVELGMLQATGRGDAALVAFSALGRGVLSGAIPDPATFGKTDLRQAMPRFSAENWPHNLVRLRAFQDFARDIGHDPASLAIAWLLSRGPHVIALPGSRSPDHMRANALGATLDLTPDQIARIDQILPVGWAHGARYGPAMSNGPQAYC
ncbi:MAG: aldo/keto reductase [Paracoccus sp. (in: a-proteobacteria)]|uniref:aldo/keto reductase n=2 Tax=Paracoccus TaxID=265 RepID=UPI0025F1E3B7|nr:MULTISPECIES: aldo/keto reductase [unclassified Paracoccus (in: a-proteobacteria)]|tara:strand:- start:6656 stop:7645 length:990 start_codon:yes stop_codon:yes gene_type:complete